MAEADDILVAFERALAADPVSAFGGIIAVNRPVPAPLAEVITQTFFEVVIAPEFAPEALEVFATKPNLRLLETGPMHRIPGEQDRRAISGGMLVQDRDAATITPESLQEVVGTLTEAERADVLFGWKVVKHVKSNAIAIVKDGVTLGMGGGQTSRVDAARIAIEQAGEAAQGAVAASDAFFPFPDGVELLADAGVGVIVQPGGSRNDDAVLETVQARQLKMAFTGLRAFRH